MKRSYVQILLVPGILLMICCFIAMRATAQEMSREDTVIVLTVDPVIDMVSFTGDEDANFELTAEAMPGGDTYVIADLYFTWLQFTPGWVSTAIYDSVTSTLVIDVDTNLLGEARSAGIAISALVNDTVLGPVLAYIIQEGTPAPFIFVSPEFQAVSYQGGPTTPFNIVHFNISGWAVDSSSMQGWISIDSVDYTNHFIIFNVEGNPDQDIRSDTITIWDTGNNSVSDELVIFQEAAPFPLLVASPRGQLVSYTGNDFVNFDVTAVNLPAGWEVDTLTLQPWITFNEQGNNLLGLDVAANTSSETRVDTVFISGIGNPSVKDSVFIFQYSDQDTFLLAAPRQKIVSYAGDPAVEFEITTANLPGGWQVDPLTIADWIVGAVNWGDSILSIDVSENTGLETRVDTIRLYATGNPGVYDSVMVYQFSSPDTFLLAAPRTQTVSHLDNPMVNFSITTANLPQNGWQVEPASVQPWITINTQGNALLSLHVWPNDSTWTRADTIILIANVNPAIHDSVIIYQYSILDTFLLAAPREHIVPYQGSDSVDFMITSANLPGGWEVDAATVAGWVTGTENIDDSVFRLQVSENPTPQTRRDTIWLRATGFPGIYDSIFLYQYSRPDTFLLAAPRERKVSHLGDTAVDYTVTVSNLPVNGWQVDPATVQPWISVTQQGDDILRLSVEQNDSLATRKDTIFLRATDNPTIQDFVFIYQYSALDTFLLAAPREKKIGYTANSGVDFRVTSANLPGGWEVDLSTLAEWVDGSVNIGDSILRLIVSENESLETRVDTIWFFGTGHPDVYDFIMIYQYSRPDTFLLAAPREQRVVHTGNSAVDFIVTASNVPAAGWQVDPATVQPWISVLEQGNNLLRLDVSPNDSLKSRIDTIWFYVGANPDIYDSVFIYQYSALDTFLLAAPRERKVGRFQTDTEFRISTANLPEGWHVSDTTTQDWITNVTNQGDTLLSLTITENPLFETRIDTIWIYANGNDYVYDSIFIFQYSYDSAYILTAPREQVIPFNYTGFLPEEFVITGVNTTALNYEVEFDPPELDEWLVTSGIVNNKLVFSVQNSNDTSVTRVARINIYDLANTVIRDSVYVYQWSNFEPYIIIIPAGKDSIGPGDTTFTVRAWSNQAEYTVTNHDEDWFHFIVGPDTVNSTVLNYDDSLTIVVDTNTNSYLARSGIISFSSDLTATDFYLGQNKAPEEYVYISGKVSVPPDGDSLAGVIVYADPFVDTTDMHGNYELKVLKGWKGRIIPEINTHYYDPTHVVIDKKEGQDIDTTGVDFNAYLIDPKVRITVYDTAICSGESLDSSLVGRYPDIFVSGTYGPESYRWHTLPEGNEGSISDTTLREPVFYPTENTTYILQLTNNNITVSDTFAIQVKPLPVAREFTGEAVVCQNQAGRVYIVNEFGEQEYFLWSLPQGGGTFVTDPTTNIVVIDWGEVPGTYELALTTFLDGCAAEPFVMIITVSEDMAPEPAGVYRKSEDNFLYCDDEEADSYRWGWYRLEGSKIVGEPYYIPDKDEWYCRLPDGYSVLSDTNRYFVEIRYEGMECFSRTFYNPPVNIEEQEALEVQVFPNPTSGELHVRFSTLTAKSEIILMIWDFTGKLVYHQALQVINGSTLTVDEARYFRPGIYLFNIQVEKKVFRNKIIVH